MKMVPLSISKNPFCLTEVLRDPGDCAFRACDGNTEAPTETDLPRDTSPLGLVGGAVPGPKVADGSATLGWGTESRWDSMHFFLSVTQTERKRGDSFPSGIAEVPKIAVVDAGDLRCQVVLPIDESSKVGTWR